MKYICTPISEKTIRELKVGDMIMISGYIYAGRDAVLPKMVELVKQNRLFEYGIDLQGSVIFHTAVSPAGVGPTSSNKLEIESSIPPLSAAGVKLHLGKGALSVNTIHDLDQYGSVYAVIPPVTALLGSKTFEQTVVAFPEEGMEAFYRLKVDGYPALIAAAHGKSIF
ncbi:MAG: fumarate hydratase [Erysipelothrix sp.]|jgi:fumarate hydratase subunit beta|nr:fumarate hydratase [Erysipelothrix sp.]